ncbi:hypothetical protein PoB_005341500 [Plakobranchus ocellatus]|uniref:Uncharacterized protein n=1 Tax=Plakobranchus ocellatus TaxID=259542 RepID=A0AAV4C660_9GAST|nr:hypothetical protein PoB_005341500 [Plakobranchus ocellatus]
MCELLTGNQGLVNSIPMPDLYSSHEEADSRIILHCMYALQQPTTERVIVRLPDSDVFLLLLSFSDAISKPLIFDTGSGNNRRQLNITDLAATMSERLRDAIISLQAFTACDSTSCFAGKGKLKALKMLQGDQDLKDTFSRFDTLETISGQDMQVIETFVCQLYGKPSHTRVRYDKVRQYFKGKKGILSNSEGVVLSQMPPCQDVLTLHTQRANLQTKIWRASSSNFPDLPKPENNGWCLSSSGGLERKWFSKDFIPNELQDILTDTLGTDDALEKELQDDNLSSHEEDISDTDDEL